MDGAGNDPKTANTTSQAIETEKDPKSKNPSGVQIVPEEHGVSAAPAATLQDTALPLEHRNPGTESNTSPIGTKPALKNESTGACPESGINSASTATIPSLKEESRGLRPGSDAISAPTLTVTRPNSNKVPQSSLRLTKENLSWKIVKTVWEIKYLLSAVTIFVVVTIFTLTANRLSWPLARLTPTSGFLLLNILAKLTDYSLAAAVDSAWENVQWGPLTKASRPLMVFLAMGSGVMGWMKIIVHGWFTRFKEIFVSEKSSASPQKSQDQPGLTVKSWNPAFHPRLMGFLRLGCWLLIQFPSIIFMVLVNPETSYEPTQWTSIAGGIGVYDTNLVTSVSDGPMLSNYVLGITSDPTKAYQAPPISAECQNDPSCLSYLVLGGIWTVSPWPFRILNDSTLTAFIAKDGPAYQVDFWDAPKGIEWGTDACTIFGPWDAAFRICNSPFNNDAGEAWLVAGIQPCLGNVHPNGTCDAEYGWYDVDFWSTFISIYRRTVTVTADQSSAAILDVSDFGGPISQNITDNDFLIAFKTMLYTYNETNSVGGACPVIGPDFQLTSTMSSLFETSLLAPEVTTPMNILRNLFVTPLFEFNAMVTNYNNFTIDPNSIPTGLPVENYVTGSYARPIIHVVPKAWTVQTYIAVTGFIIFVLIVTLFYTMIKYELPETSDFSIIDNLRLQNGNGGSLRDAFSEAALEDDWKMMKEAVHVSIKLS